jgi:hypothetical protein
VPRFVGQRRAVQIDRNAADGVLLTPERMSATLTNDVEYPSSLRRDFRPDAVSRQQRDS